jgi:HEAT repeat protein
LLKNGDRNRNAIIFNFAQTLASMGPDAAAPLFDLLGDSNPQIAPVALQALALLGPPAAEKLPSALESKNQVVRRSAFELASRLGPTLTKKALPQIMEGLKDSDMTIRLRALNIVIQSGPEARTAVPALIDMLKDDKVLAFRIQAAQALGRIGPDAKAALPQLKEACKDARAALRLRAAEALGLIQPDGDDGTKALLDLIRLPQTEMAGISLAQIVDVLARQQVDFDRILPALEDYRRNHNDVNSGASLANALLNFYPGLPAARPLLENLLKDKNSNGRQEAALALCRYGKDGKSAAPVLLQMLRSNYQTERVALGFEQLGSAAREAVPVLLERWDVEADPNARLALAGAILAIDREQGKSVLDWLHQQVPESVRPSPSLPAFRLLCRNDSKNPAVHKALERLVQEKTLVFDLATIEVIGLLGKDGQPFVPYLKTQLKSTIAEHRVRAAFALWQIEGKADEVVPILAAALKEEGHVIRRGNSMAQNYSAAQYLGEIGPPARSALPALQEVQLQGDPALSLQAQIAIRKIGKK